MCPILLVHISVGRIILPRGRYQFWDLGGQTDLQGLWTKYYPECHSILFVVDATDTARMEEVGHIFETLINDDDVEGVPILILANKQDCQNALPIEGIKEIFNPIASKLNARESQVFAISALKGDGVKPAIDHLMARMQQNIAQRPPTYY